MIGNGCLDPCYETPEELEFKRKRLLAQGRPPVYDRAALNLSDADRARLEGATRLPPEPWTIATWKDWTSVLGPATGRQGRMLFHPLRLVLTGRETGPEMTMLPP